MTSLRVVREEEDDSGFSRQVTLVWFLSKFRNMYQKARPRQRLTSSPFEVKNCCGFDLEGKVMFFPKGVGNSADGASPAGGGTEPVLGVEFSHVPRDPDPHASISKKRAKKRVSTPFAIEVEGFAESTVAIDGDAATDEDSVSLGPCQEVRVTRRIGPMLWAAPPPTTIGIGSPDRGGDNGLRSQASTSEKLPESEQNNLIPVPNAFTADQLLKVATSLRIVIRITMLSHADDISDLSDDFGLLEAKEKRDEAEELRSTRPTAEQQQQDSSLFSNVLSTGQGMWSNLLSSDTMQHVLSSATHVVGSPSKDSGHKGDGDDQSNSSASVAAALPIAASIASAIVATAKSAEVFVKHQDDVDFSSEWVPLFECFTSDQSAPHEWKHLTPGCWAVFVHSIVAIPELFLSPSDSWDEATTSWSRPSPHLVTKVCEWCPSIKTLLATLVPERISIKTFWTRLFAVLDKCSRLSPLTEIDLLHNTLVHLCCASHQYLELQPNRGDEGHPALADGADLQSKEAIQKAVRLLSFVLKSSNVNSSLADVVEVTYLSKKDVEQQLSVVKSALAFLAKVKASIRGSASISAAMEQERREATLRMVQQLREIQVAWRREEATGLSSHHEMVEEARKICEVGVWSLQARRQLASAGERNGHAVSEISDVCALVAETANELSAQLDRNDNDT